MMLSFQRAIRPASTPPADENTPPATSSVEPNGPEYVNASSANTPLSMPIPNDDTPEPFHDATPCATGPNGTHWCRSPPPTNRPLYGVNANTPFRMPPLTGAHRYRFHTARQLMGSPPTEVNDPPQYSSLPYT